MPSTYFDANVLVKLVLDERDSDVAGEVWNQADSRHASPLAFVEACAALAAAHRNHALDASRHQESQADVRAIRGQLGTVHLTDAIAGHAAELADRHALKGADAVHLASALALRDLDIVVATWDRRLHSAAQAEGLRVAPATLTA